jgi:hypothetical protein
MTTSLSRERGFNATPVIDQQVMVSIEPPQAPSSYEVTDLGGAWLARDPGLPLVQLRDRSGRSIAVAVGQIHSEFVGRFLPAGVADLPMDVVDIAALETEVLPRLAGMFLLFTTGDLPRRIYPDHAGSLSLVYSPPDRRAASSSSLLLDEAAYQARFRADLHKALVLREGQGGWISGTLTAHRDVFRLLPNHYLDLASWTTHRFWPRPGDFAQWRDMPQAVEGAADALRSFAHSANQAFRVTATLTAGFDSRLLVAACHDELARCGFFTIGDGSPSIDTDMSQVIARKFGLNHKMVLPIQASPAEMAVWDRTVGDCMFEAPRQTYLTIGGLTDRDAVFTGMYGEVGRCRLYRQDLNQINQARIDARFVIDRLTLPAHPELIENVDIWFKGLAGQPNSVIMDLAFHELKFGSWAMGQRPMTNSVKLNLLPFAQRRVLDAFIGVAPADKGTQALFWAIIGRLWPQLSEVPINKYGDLRDYLTLWQKISNPGRVRRYLRDRLARKSA